MVSPSPDMRDERGWRAWDSRRWKEKHRESQETKQQHTHNETHKNDTRETLLCNVPCAYQHCFSPFLSPSLPSRLFPLRFSESEFDLAGLYQYVFTPHPTRHGHLSHHRTLAVDSLLIHSHHSFRLSLPLSPPLCPGISILNFHPIRIHSSCAWRGRWISHQHSSIERSDGKTHARQTDARNNNDTSCPSPQTPRSSLSLLLLFCLHRAISFVKVSIRRRSTIRSTFVMISRNDMSD